VADLAEGAVVNELLDEADRWREAISQLENKDQ